MGASAAAGSSAIEAAKRAGNINIAEEGKTEVSGWVGCMLSFGHSFIHPPTHPPTPPL